MDYSRENIMKYAYFSRINENLTLDEACQFIGGLYTTHSSCQSKDAFYIWDVFESDYLKSKQKYEIHFEFSQDKLKSKPEELRMKTLMYTLPRTGKTREKTVFLAGIQVKTSTPAIPGKEFGYVRIYRVSCEY